jgi:hypothetical protein
MQSVVANTEVTNVVLEQVSLVASRVDRKMYHSGNGEAGHDTGDYQCRPEETLSWLSNFNGCQAAEEEDDWQDGGESREARIVVKLDLLATISQYNRAVSYEVHALNAILAPVFDN